MSARVLSTQEAKDAITRIQQIIEGGLTEQLQQLDTEGTKLSEPNNWDGPLAEQFRSSTWPETNAALDKAKQELQELQVQLQKISQDIFTAGGGA